MADLEYEEGNQDEAEKRQTDAEEGSAVEWAPVESMPVRP
jgi:hypothetical protein